MIKAQRFVFALTVGLTEEKKFKEGRAMLKLSSRFASSVSSSH